MKQRFKCSAENLINFPHLHLLGYYGFCFAKKIVRLFFFLGCSSREMRHKILKNAAVEINCETMHTLKSVSLLINLQERIPNELKADWQGGGAQVTRETRCQMATLHIFQMLMNFCSERVGIGDELGSSLRSTSAGCRLIARVQKP